MGSAPPSVGSSVASTASTRVTDSAPTTAPGVQPTGFATIRAEVTKADGTSCELCLWSAGTDAQRGRGLMGVESLGAADGMVFSWPGESTAQFYMYGTPTPLTIAWVASDGTVLSVDRMEPCLVDDPAACARYSPGVPYRYAIETFTEGEQLLEPGDVVVLTDGSGSTDCPLD